MTDADFSAHSEYWRADVGSEPVAVLNVPGLVGRARVFDVDVTLLVDVPDAAVMGWHELTVEFDGQRQWSHRVTSQSPGQTDGLEYHQRLRLEAEQGVRIRATAAVKGVGIRQLLLEAREDRYL